MGEARRRLSLLLNCLSTTYFPPAARREFNNSAHASAAFAAGIGAPARKMPMAYNTGNPIGSTSPKDLSDNARNLDLLLLGDEPSYHDRKGVPRKSWKGIEREFDADQSVREYQFTAFLSASGYEAPVLYESGLTLSRATQVVTHLGKEYRVKSEFLPLTTTVWGADESKLKLIGDDSLRQEVSNLANPELGAGMVGMDGRWLRDYLKQQEYFLTIEYFGLTDTATNTKETMQTAINFCALHGILLRNKASTYTIDVSASSITIPNNFRCEIYAQIFRETGNQTPHDMWVNADMVNGNTGLDIRGVQFDGQRQADDLNKGNPAHRFCGLRLVKCSGELYNCRVNNTVNAEVQGEGNRGGIMLDRSVDMKVSMLFADGTDGSGVFCYQGKNYVEGVWTKNNTGSGFTSFGCDNNDFHHIFSDGSGYSGVSVNGMNMRCSFLTSKNSPVGFAGVNIGHDNAGNSATGSQVDTVTVEGALGWGIVLAGSSNVTATNWKASGSALNNLRVTNSPGLNITYRGENSLGSDTFIAGLGEHFGQFVISGAAFNGLATGTVAGTKVSMGELSYITGCGSTEVNTAGVNVNDNSEVVIRGKIINNRQCGVIAAGDADAVAVLTSAAKISGNEAGNVLSLTGGVLRYEGAKFSDDVMSGNVTIGAGSTLTTVLNGNAVDPNRITLVPGNAAARAAGQALVSSIEAGKSFGVQISASAAAAVIYRWAIL